MNGVIQLGNICPTKTRDNPNQGRVYSGSGIAPALTNVGGGGNREPWTIGDMMGRYRIRKITPRECGRLMGVREEDIDRILAVQSNTQAYKEFGNGIVVSCLEAIFSQLNIKGVPTWDEYSRKYADLKIA